MKILLLYSFLPALVLSFNPQSNRFAYSNSLPMSSSSALSSKPFAIVVDAEIVPDRRDEFLDIIEKDAVGSRAEPGCIRFG